MEDRTSRTTTLPAPRAPTEDVEIRRRAASSHLLYALLLLACEAAFVLLNRLPLVPFGSFLSGLAIAVLWAFLKKPTDLDYARRLCVLLILQAALVVVASTQGLFSPVTTLLLAPILFAAVFIDTRTTLFVGIGVALFIFSSGIQQAMNGPLQEETRVEIIRNVVLVVVALAFALVNHRADREAVAAMRRAEEHEERARVALARAEQEEARLGELIWQSESARMMESLPTLENALAVALIRLSDRVPFDFGVIYIRDLESQNDVWRAMQDFGKVPQLDADPSEAPSVYPPLSVRELETFAVLQRTRLWLAEPVDSATHVEPGDLTALVQCLDPDARAAIFAPLRTLDEDVGLICLFTHTEDGLCPTDSERLERFAQNIVFPIQRLRLQTLATTDVLTNLLNQRDFRRRLRQELDRAERYGGVMSLILLDIDRFKAVNDVHGHRAGDAVLAALGLLLRKSVRGIDSPARYGGEEMAVICPETTLEDAFLLAERLRRRLADTPIALPDGGELSLTASFGVADTRFGFDPGVIVEHADQALLRAKAEGRNRVCAAKPAPSPKEAHEISRE